MKTPEEILTKVLNEWDNPNDLDLMSILAKRSLPFMEKAMNEYAKEEAIRFSEHLLHGDWRLNPHSEKTLWRTVNQVEQLGGTKHIHEGITTDKVYELFKELHP